MGRRTGLFVIEPQSFEMVYGREEIEAISRHVEIFAPPQSRESIARDSSVLSDVELIFGGWGMPVIDADFLRAAPRLQAVFYAAGSTGSWMTDAAWERGIQVTSALEANAIPVAEYTLATTLFSLKHGWSLARRTRSERTFPNRNGAPGAYQSTVGLISLGAVGRRVASMLRQFELKVIAYDPFVTAEQGAVLGVEMVKLEELFQRSDVVSLHTPSLPETRGMITGHHLAAMKQGATLINTSRGAIIREEEMLDVLERRPDLQAVLDTVHDEPPPKQSRLYSLENVLMTPHIAGSVGHECRRMARYMIEELHRYIEGEPLRWAVKEPVQHKSNRSSAAARAGIETLHIDISGEISGTQTSGRETTGRKKTGKVEAGI